MTFKLKVGLLIGSWRVLNHLIGNGEPHNKPLTCGNVLGGLNWLMVNQVTGACWRETVGGLL